MANHKSAWKRIRQNTKRRVRNVHYKTIVKNHIKTVREAIKAGQSEGAREALAKAMSAIDHVASKGTIHRNAAARKISRLSKAVHNMVSSTAG